MEARRRQGGRSAEDGRMRRRRRGQGGHPEVLGLLLPSLSVCESSRSKLEGGTCFGWSEVEQRESLQEERDGRAREGRVDAVLLLLHCIAIAGLLARVRWQKIGKVKGAIPQCDDILLKSSKSRSLSFFPSCQPEHTARQDARTRRSQTSCCTRRGDDPTIFKEKDKDLQRRRSDGNDQWKQWQRSEA